MKTQLPVIQPNSLRVVLRVLFMLAVPLVGFALFAGNIHISNAASTFVIEMKDYQYQNVDQLDANGDINVPLGATVAWTNTDPAPHDVAILDGPVLNVSPEVKNPATHGA